MVGGVKLKDRFLSSQLQDLDRHSNRPDDSIMRDSNELYTGASVSPNAFRSIREINLNNISKIQSSLSVNAEEFLSPEQFFQQYKPRKIDQMQQLSVSIDQNQFSALETEVYSNRKTLKKQQTAQKTIEPRELSVSGSYLKTDAMRYQSVDTFAVAPMPLTLADEPNLDSPAIKLGGSCFDEYLQQRNMKLPKNKSFVKPIFEASPVQEPSQMTGTEKRKYMANLIMKKERRE